jgi:hypothetical protein
MGFKRPRTIAVRCFAKFGPARVSECSKLDNSVADRKGGETGTLKLEVADASEVPCSGVKLLK